MYLSPEPFDGVYAYMVTTDREWNQVYYYDSDGATCVMSKATSKNNIVFKMYISDTYGACDHKIRGWNRAEIFYDEEYTPISLAGPDN